jgi:hypothetical protein
MKPYNERLIKLMMTKEQIDALTKMLFRQDRPELSKENNIKTNINRLHKTIQFSECGCGCNEND